MAGKSSDLFRKKSLERLSSPGSVDQLIQVVSRRDWVAVAAALLVSGAAVWWSCAATIPTTVNARGVLLRPRNIVFAQTLSGGRLVEIVVRAGDVVRKGARIGRVDQSELRQRIAGDRALAESLQSQDRLKAAGEEQQARLQRRQDTLERAGLAEQKRNLERSLAGTLEVRPLIQKRLDIMRKLREEGLIAEGSQDWVEAEQALRDNEAKTLDYRSRIEQFEAQLQQMETRFSTLDRANLESSTQRTNQIREVKARIAAAELQLAHSGDVLSEAEGRVVEVFAAPGQVISPGGRILSLDTAEASAPLVGLLYFAVGDGKKVLAGMPVQLSPDTVQRERYGGIRGTVSAVSPLPVSREGALRTIGSEEVVDSILGKSACIEVTVALETAPDTASGYRWTSSRGPEQGISPGLTGQGYVTVEWRRPVSYVFPFLRESSGVF